MEILSKIKSHYWNKIVSHSRKKSYYPFLYKSYWYFLLNKTEHTNNSINYYTANPNPGAGIGHQMANWIAGYWFARQFGLQFAHIPFSKAQWDAFLGFGINEKKVSDLINNSYKKVRLPIFDENNFEEVELQKRIISSYANKNVIFIAEQDQFHQDQFVVMEDIKNKFFNAPSRKNDSLLYDKNNFNVAIHVRRGDIVIGQENKNTNLLMRWNSHQYFLNVLQNVLKIQETTKPISIYLFSQGTENDYAEFKQFKDIHFCLDMNAQDSFLHMVFADLLITSKSSFSYKPALISKGIKVCPEDFWHGYPKNNNWILANADGALKLN